MKGICFSPTAFCFLPSAFCLLLTAYCIDGRCISEFRIQNSPCPLKRGGRKKGVIESVDFGFSQSDNSQAAGIRSAPRP